MRQKYDFRQEHYIIVKVILDLATFAKSICLNIDYDITLIDRQFLSK